MIITSIDELTTRQGKQFWKVMFQNEMLPLLMWKAPPSEWIYGANVQVGVKETKNKNGEPYLTLDIDNPSGIVGVGTRVKETHIHVPPKMPDKSEDILMQVCLKAIIELHASGKDSVTKKEIAATAGETLELYDFISANIKQVKQSG